MLRLYPPANAAALSAALQSGGGSGSPEEDALLKQAS